MASRFGIRNKLKELAQAASEPSKGSPGSKTSQVLQEKFDTQDQAWGFYRNRVFDKLRPWM